MKERFTSENISLSKSHTVPANCLLTACPLLSWRLQNATIFWESQWRNANACLNVPSYTGDFWAVHMPCSEMRQNWDFQQTDVTFVFLGIQFFFSNGCSQLAMCLCHYNYSVSTLESCFSFLFILFCFHASVSLRMRHSFLPADLTSNDSHLSLWCASCWVCKNCFQEALLLYQILVMRQEGRADCQGKKKSSADGRNAPDSRPSM